MTLRFSRLSLLWKIMLSTSVAVTVLFAITGEIVLRNINKTMSDSLEEEVQASFHAYASLWQSRTDLLTSVSLIISGMPDVRAAFSTGDQATIRDSAGELWSKISTSSGIFLVTEPSGRVIASLGGVTAPALRKKLDMVQTAAANFPKQASGFFLQAGELYHLSVTPVYVQSTRGLDLQNVLVAGYRVDALVAQRLKEATNSEFLFLTPSGVIASTLNPRATGVVVENIARQHGSERVGDGVAEYALYQTELTDITGQPVGKICILRSFEGSRRRIASLYSNILLLWLLAMTGGFVLTYVLARRFFGSRAGLLATLFALLCSRYGVELLPQEYSVYLTPGLGDRLLHRRHADGGDAGLHGGTQRRADHGLHLLHRTGRLHRAGRARRVHRRGAARRRRGGDEQEGLPRRQ
jgi:hypothetical protein